MAMLRPASEMKDSGIEWMGTVRSEWQSVPLKRIVVSRNGGAWGEEPTENNSVICMRIADFDFDKGRFADKRIEELTKRSYSSEQVSKLVLQPDDICIEKSGGGEKTPVGRAVVFDKPYTALFANFMDRLRMNTTVVVPLFVEYFLRGMYYQNVMPVYIKQTTGIQNLNLTSLLEKEYICLPSYEEQQAIADYLDDRCSKIDEIIAKATASIEEYKELKQAVIFEAVTGLKENQEFYDSCNEVIGRIPLEWRKVRVKDISSRITVGVVVTPAVYFDDNGTIPFLRGINVKEYVINDDPMVYITQETNRVLSKTVVHTNDLVVVRDGAIGVTAVVPEKFDGANVVSMIIVTPAVTCNSDYLCYVMNSQIGKVQFDLTKIGAALTHTSVKAVSNIEIPLPPIEEQIKIVDYLNRRKGQMDALISEKQSLIEDLQAYKKSLIYEVVTGKRRVV